MRGFHNKEDGTPAGPPLCSWDQVSIQATLTHVGALSLGRGLPLPAWPWNYPVSPPRPPPSDPVLWAESSSWAVSVCDP